MWVFWVLKPWTRPFLPGLCVQLKSQKCSLGPVQTWDFLSNFTNLDSWMVCCLVERHGTTYIWNIFETKWITLVLLKFGLNSLGGSKLTIGYDGHVNKHKNKWFKFKHVQTGFLLKAPLTGPSLPPCNLHILFFSNCISVKSSSRTLMPYRSAFYIEFQACQMNENLRHRGNFAPWSASGAVSSVSVNSNSIVRLFM